MRRWNCKLVECDRRLGLFTERELFSFKRRQFGLEERRKHRVSVIARALKRLISGSKRFFDLLDLLKRAYTCKKRREKRSSATETYVERRRSF